MIVPVERRQVLLGLVGVGAAGALAACSSASSTPGSSSVPAPSSPSSTPTTAPASSSGAAPAAGALTTTDAVPVGGGIIVDTGTAAYAVTQPEAGTFACFSAVCPHQGCNCNAVADGLITCPCHGSQFSARTGEVVKGPATSGLAPAPIVVSGTEITLKS